MQNKKEAKPFQNIWSQVAKGISGNPLVRINYRLSDPGIHGQVKLIDEVVVHVQEG